MHYCDVGEHLVPELKDHLFWWGTEWFLDGIDHFYIPPKTNISNACPECWDLIKDDLQDDLHENDTLMKGATLGLWLAWKAGLPKADLEDVAFGPASDFFHECLMEDVRAILRHNRNSVIEEDDSEPILKNGWFQKNSAMV